MNILFASAAEALTLETAVLLLVTAGLLVLAKIVSDLRAEVRSLRGVPDGERQPLSGPPVPAAPQAKPEIPADVFSAIVAAVYCTMGEQHRIVSVSPAESLMWSREGRRSIFRSHSFR
jgi:hypothetical protein